MSSIRIAMIQLKNFYHDQALEAECLIRKGVRSYEMEHIKYMEENR